VYQVSDFHLVTFSGFTGVKKNIMKYSYSEKKRDNQKPSIEGKTKHQPNEKGPNAKP
jgi:20S proteasome alpha/beta subunit